MDSILFRQKAYPKQVIPICNIPDGDTFTTISGDTWKIVASTKYSVCAEKTGVLRLFDPSEHVFSNELERKMPSQLIFGDIIRVEGVIHSVVLSVSDKDSSGEALHDKLRVTSIGTDGIVRDRGFSKDEFVYIFEAYLENQEDSKKELIPKDYTKWAK